MAFIICIKGIYRYYFSLVLRTRKRNACTWSRWNNGWGCQGNSVSGKWWRVIYHWGNAVNWRRACGHVPKINQSHEMRSHVEATLAMLRLNVVEGKIRDDCWFNYLDFILKRQRLDDQSSLNFFPFNSVCPVRHLCTSFLKKLYNYWDHFNELYDFYQLHHNRKYLYASILNIEVQHEVKHQRASANRTPQIMKNGQDVYIQMRSGTECSR